MKRILMSIAVLALCAMTAQAQENKDTQKTTTVKKVTQKDTDVKTKVVAETETNREVVKVEGTSKQDQASRVVNDKSKDTAVVKNDVSIDLANQQRMTAIKERQEAELAKNIAQQKERAAMQAEKERQAKLAQQQQELAARKAALETRPEGMAKLDKDKK